MRNAVTPLPRRPRCPALELTVERLDDGEVSPFLTGQLQPDDTIQLRGPIGGHFVWSALERRHPLLLVGGGSGIVPLMCMLRHRRLSGSAVPAALLYSARTREDVIYHEELDGSRTQRSPVHASDHADAGFCAGLVRRGRAYRPASRPGAAETTSAEWRTASSAVPPDSWRRRLPCWYRRDSRATRSAPSGLGQQERSNPDDMLVRPEVGAVRSE